MDTVWTFNNLLDIRAFGVLLANCGYFGHQNICKEKNNVLAKYALSSMSRPLGIPEYEIINQPLPDELKNTLPTQEEIAKAASLS